MKQYSYLIHGVITFWVLVVCALAIYFVIPAVGWVFGYPFWEVAKHGVCIFFGVLTVFFVMGTILIANEKIK